MYTNRPFQKEKKIQIVKTEFGGWGVEAAEFINQDNFVIEYIGEGNFIKVKLQLAAVRLYDGILVWKGSRHSVGKLYYISLRV
ncbi:hypothetical protein Vadar_031982 [Vaccinium darrowii]|uniref:Uncharacterized protein n=1 Tax=Vaccinium darrowii TaxID=229202 RepID=A0ACB7Z0A6_9ERIC|nr:hypothetical protein Vadar_031982 [Vaccinium darrowii]